MTMESTSTSEENAIMDRSRTLMEPTCYTTPFGAFEISAHTCSRTMLRDLKQVFPDLGLTLRKGDDAEKDSRDGHGNERWVGAEEFLVVPTCQRSSLDLLGLSREVAEEKDKLLENFLGFCEALWVELSKENFWMDYCDPCSGLPVKSNGNVVYPEVQNLESLRKYRSSVAGGCKVCIHPEWGTGMYPASLFTNAPVDVLIKVISSLQVAQTTERTRIQGEETSKKSDTDVNYVC